VPSRRSREWYGWTGYDYSIEENNLLDIQFQYHITYLKSIEKITGENISEAINLDKHKLAMIKKLTSNPKVRGHFWAKWMMRKLRIKE
jgi:hypothetical protein